MTQPCFLLFVLADRKRLAKSHDLGVDSIAGARRVNEFWQYMKGAAMAMNSKVAGPPVPAGAIRLMVTEQRR